MRSAVQRGERLRVHVWNQTKAHRGFWSLLSLHPAVGEETITAVSAQNDSFSHRMKGTTIRSPRPSKENHELTPTPEGTPPPRRAPPGSSEGTISEETVSEIFSHTETDPPLTSTFPVRMRTRYMMGVQLRLRPEEMRLLAELCAWAAEENGADSTSPGSDRPTSPDITSPKLGPVMRKHHQQAQAAPAMQLAPAASTVLGHAATNAAEHWPAHWPVT